MHYASLNQLWTCVILPHSFTSWKISQNNNLMHATISRNLIEEANFLVYSYYLHILINLNVLTQIKWTTLYTVPYLLSTMFIILSSILFTIQFKENLFRFGLNWIIIVNNNTKCYHIWWNIYAVVDFVNHLFVWSLFVRVIVIPIALERAC